MNEARINAFKKVMNNYPTGVTIVTTMDRQVNSPVGLTISSFASVSIDPLMVLWCIDHRASSLEAFKKADGFAVHILASNQKEACWAFAGKEPDRFSKVEWGLSERNLPILSHCSSVLECKTVQQVVAGDHTIFIGEVLEINQSDNEPMLYFRQKVGSPPSMLEA